MESNDFDLLENMPPPTNEFLDRVNRHNERMRIRNGLVKEINMSYPTDGITEYLKSVNYSDSCVEDQNNYLINAVKIQEILIEKINKK